MPHRSPILSLYEDEGINVLRASTIDEVMTLQKVMIPPEHIATVEPPTGLGRFLLNIFLNYRVGHSTLIMTL
jgi:hypothetical protein